MLDNRLNVKSLFLTMSLVTMSVNATSQFKSNPILSNLEPSNVWSFFDNISRIPRGSGNEQAVAAYVINVAESKGLEARVDSIGNVIVKKPASSPQFAGRPIVVMQSHLDMVCEKNKDVVHDFTKDPIKLEIKGKYLGAQGTTLGADDGIGVSLMLAAMTSDFDHGPLEFLFTVNEEDGFDGARGVSPQTIDGRIFLNLDSEEEGIFYVGCAGGCGVVGNMPVTHQAPETTDKFYRISVTGLKGGHSGVDINAGRINAIKVKSELLQVVTAHGGRIAMVDGGNKRNAIARYCEAVVAIPGHTEAVFCAEFNKKAETVLADIKLKEASAMIHLKAADALPRVMGHQDSINVHKLLSEIPHGVMAMHPKIEGLVETSTNLARVFCSDNGVVIETSQRSLIEADKHILAKKVADILSNIGAQAEVGDGYPGWQPRLDSRILEFAQQTHEKVFGGRPQIKAIHAGLECGEIGMRIPGMDMVSFGPTIVDAHSPDERVEIAAVGKFWTFLKQLLSDVAHDDGSKI